MEAPLTIRPVADLRIGDTHTKDSNLIYNSTPMSVKGDGAESSC